MAFARFKITVDDKSFFFLAPKDSYEDLSTLATGVSKVNITGAADDFDETAPVCTVQALLRSKFAVRKTIAYTTGSGATLRRRYSRIIVAKNKAAAFAPTGSYKGGTIRDVINSGDAIFS